MRQPSCLSPRIGAYQHGREAAALLAEILAGELTCATPPLSMGRQKASTWRPMFELTQLRSLWRSREELHFSRAARRLNMNSALQDRDLAWADRFIASGMATFVVDSFSPRGVKGFARQPSFFASVADLYAALHLLRTHPRIDPARIALMGFSARGTDGVPRPGARRTRRGGRGTRLCRRARALSGAGPPSSWTASHAGGACERCGRPHGLALRCLPDGRWFDPGGVPGATAAAAGRRAGPTSRR